MFVKAPPEGYLCLAKTIFQFFIEAAVITVAINLILSAFGANTPGFFPTLIIVSLFHLIP